MPRPTKQTKRLCGNCGKNEPLSFTNYCQACVNCGLSKRDLERQKEIPIVQTQLEKLSAWSG